MLGGVVVTWALKADNVVLPFLGELEAWQLTFLIVGLPGLLIALLMAMTVSEPPRRGVQAMEPLVPLRDVLRFVWAERGAYVSHILGVAIFVMVVYALNLWGPSYFIRTFGYSPGEAGLTFGLIMLLAGSAGLLLAGWLADRLLARGILDAYPRIILTSIVGLLPPTLLLGVVASPGAGIVVMSLAVFFSAFQGGISGGTLQLMTPNRLRGRVYALYLLCTSLIGLGFGPTVVAMTTDYVFANDAAIGKSIALSAAILCPLSIFILWRALPAIRARMHSELRATTTGIGS
jgi:MFS family permease